MKRSILIRGARQLVTLKGRSGPRRGEEMQEVGVIQDGSVLIADGLILRVGPTRQVENLAEARKADEISASGRVVMPAFVDAHAHLVAAPARPQSGNSADSADCDSPATQEFVRAVQWVRNASPSTLKANARRYLEAAVRHGTLTLETKSGRGLNLAAETKILRVLGELGDSPLSLIPTYCGALALPPEYSDPAEYIATVCTEAIPKLRERKLVRYVDAQCDSTGFSAEHLRPYLNVASRAGYPVKLHGDQRVRAGCVPLALEFGAVCVAGLNQADATDLESLARSSTIATLLPVSALDPTIRRLAPGRLLLDAGAAVALGSNFRPCARSTFNMQTVISFACQTLSFSVEEAISAATVNAAHAAGRGGVCGTLETGRAADLLMLNVSDYRELPLHFGANLVGVVMRRGEVVWREGPVTCENS